MFAVMNKGSSTMISIITDMIFHVTLFSKSV